MVNPDPSSPVKGATNVTKQRRVPTAGATSGTTEDDEEEEDDEHSLIARYCQRLNEVTTLDQLSDTDSDSACGGGSSSLPRRKRDLERMISRLEAENARLTDEYDELRTTRLRQDAAADPDAEEEEEEEAKRLKQHSSRMETRMRILEDHNAQLEAQLQRLRQLLQTAGGGAGGVSSPTQLASPTNQASVKNFGTLQSRSVVAAQLQADEPTGAGMSDSMGRRRRDPPNSSSSVKNGGHDDADSLDLSDHDAQRVSD